MVQCFPDTLRETGIVPFLLLSFSSGSSFPWLPSVTVRDKKEEKGDDAMIARKAKEKKNLPLGNGLGEIQGVSIAF